MTDGAVPDRLLRGLCLLLPSRYREDVYGDLVEEARERTRDGQDRKRVGGWILAQLLRTIPLLYINSVERAMDRMSRRFRGGGVAYGLLAFVAIFSLLDLAPQPAGTLVLTGWIVVSLVAAGIATLRRTNFLFMGTGMLVAAMELVVLGTLIVAGTISAPPRNAWLLIPTVLSILGWLALMAIDRYRLPEEYETWKRRIERTDLVDMLFLRHIPHLR